MFIVVDMSTGFYSYSIQKFKIVFSSLKLDFLTTSFLFPMVTLYFFNKSLGQVLAWKSGLKVHLLPLGPSCPLQTILLSDLVKCDSPLQIVMAVL
jgi:hypothetical protein